MRNVFAPLNRHRLLTLLSTAVNHNRHVGTMLRYSVSPEVQMDTRHRLYLLQQQLFSTGFASVHGERPSAEYAKLRKESLESEFGHTVGTHSSTSVSAVYRFGPFLALYRAAIISFHVLKLTIWHFFFRDIKERAVKFREMLIRLGPFYVKAHNNLVSEPAVMGDEKTLTAKLEAFMEQMATRQQALEEQVAILSLSVQKITKGDSKKNNEEQGNNEGTKRNSDARHGGCMVPRYSKMEFRTYDGVEDPLGTANLRLRQQVNPFTARLVEELRIDIEMQQQENLGVAMNMARTLELGQALSTRADILPPVYCQELAKLQDQIPPFPTRIAKKSIETELGIPISEIFSDISPEPIAAASLGQVYKACLHSGELVAVKVQRPGMSLMLTLDALLFHMIGGQIKRFAKARKDLLVAVNEMVRHMFDEIDYVLEARNAERFASLYSGWPGDGHTSNHNAKGVNTIKNKNAKGIKVPKIYWNLTRKTVLTMEWVDGIKLTDEAALKKAYLNRRELIDQGVYCSLRQMLEVGFFHADPHPGNLLATSCGSLAYFDFGMMGDIPRHYRVGLIQVLVHFVNHDSLGLANDYLSLGFIPEGADIQSVADALQTSFGNGTRQSKDFQLRGEIHVKDWLFLEHGRSKNSFSSRPVTRSYAKVHNNFISEPAVMGDKKTLTTKLKAFMEQIATRQEALEEQVAILSLSVQKITKGDSEKNNEEQGSSGGRKRNLDLQHDDKVSLASFRLLREEQLWLDQMEEREANLDWGRFKECCHVRFGPPMSNNPLGELANLKQTGTVEEYQHQFQSLLAGTTNLKPRQQVNLFTAGLIKELRIDIEMQKPKNHGVATNMARTLEHKQNVSSKLSSRAIQNWPTSQNTGSNSIIPTTKSIAKGGGQTIEPTGNNGKMCSSAPFIKRLTQTEMAERMAKGLCYNCDESYSMGYKGIMNQLYDVMYDFNFSLPPDYALVVRALGSLEGTAKALDPNFKVVESAYPLVIGRLLADPSPDMRKILRELLIRNNGSIRWNRLERLVAAISEQASEEPPESEENDSPPSGWKSFNMHAVVDATEDLLLFILSEKGLMVRVFLLRDIIRAADIFLQDEVFGCRLEAESKARRTSEFEDGAIMSRVVNGFGSLHRAVKSAPEIWTAMLMRIVLKPQTLSFSVDIISAVCNHVSNKFPESFWVCMSRLIHELSKTHAPDTRMR
ncbi:hypothetical protein GOBAR_AA34282 [Gossypium barbadense]|uniref:ABC1 atypical kinase-like domain-containing protein n=1 Tax=Gossypium barbadense TaxID=3634 RepID=A0A2P5W5R4_GOSBA|nr:hypothetical protein GOBAR_AA34282 [Gossypium barbadense]